MRHTTRDGRPKLTSCRQKLLNQALQKEIEAESFGKTAKWLSSGSFQGFLAGSGIGSVPGVTLGTLTGTLVGGVTTLITGGLGGAVGAGVGAVHGPFFKMGDVVGGALNKWLPTIPGWTASKEQKHSLEKMLGQIKDEERPSNEELQELSKSAASSASSAQQYMKRPAKPVTSAKPESEKQASVSGQKSAKMPTKSKTSKESQMSSDSTRDEATDPQVKPTSQRKGKPKKLQVRSSDSSKG